ncbi:MAG: shikimate kinase [Bacteroidetes bacterium]|nr:shikimate kinase [Bacteroidota bacterium]
MRVYLIGYMASGKSNIGKQLAEELGYRFIDLDYIFEERFRISVLDFFEKYDESAFRKIEQLLLQETIDMEDIVISTGGGTPCFFDNMNVIKNAGISIYLFWKVPSLVRRLKMARRRRPLLKGIPPSGLESQVGAHLAQRECYYNQADIIIEGEGLRLESLLSLVLSRINEA